MSGLIAHVGPNLPQELLRATGRHAGALSFDPDRPTPVAEQWVETKFAPWARVIVETWAAGEYDGLAQVLFSRADDNAQRLYYYLCELQRRGLVGGPEALILDIAKVPRETSVLRTETSLRALAERFEVDDAALAAAVEACNAERAAQVPGPVSGTACLLTGTPPPDRRLHEVIERAGFTAVGPTLEETWTQLGAPVAVIEADPIAGLARQLHDDPAGPRSFADAGAVLRQALADAGAQAVVLWQIEEDEAQAWHLPAQRAALDAVEVLSLVMTRRDWLARDGAAAEITSFLEGLS